MKKVLLVHGSQSHNDFGEVRSELERFNLVLGDFIFVAAGSGTAAEVKSYLAGCNHLTSLDFWLSVPTGGKAVVQQRNSAMIERAILLSKHCGFTLRALAFPSLDEDDDDGVYDFIERCNANAIKTRVLPLLLGRLLANAK